MMDRLLAKVPDYTRFQRDPEALPWIGSAHPARKESAPVPPSFRVSMDALVRRYAIEAQDPRSSCFSQLAKDRGWVSRHAQSLGVQTARVLRDDFPLQYLRDNLHGLETFVIKPLYAHSARGVLLLKREGEVSFFCLQGRTRLRLVHLLDRLNQAMRQHHFSNHWQVEELLLSPSGVPQPLDDFKFYCFRGRVGLILQVSRRHGRQAYRWYDRRWRPVHTGKYEDAIDPNLLPPRAAGSLLDAAERVSASLPSPFCRIDLYETDRGVVLGELTPEPGTYHEFGDVADRYLGAMFEMAALTSD